MARYTMMKKFLIIGNMNAVITKDIFPFIKYNKLWLGVTKVYEFIQPDSNIKKFGNICWYTNIDHKKLHEPIAIYKHYSDVLYPKFDNYDAINVNKTCEIPMDYDGVMGVPISFLDNYWPEQFEIVWRGGDIEWAENECDFYTPPTRENAELYKKQDRTWRIQNPYLLDGNGDVRTVYSRIFIRRKKMNKKFLIIGNMNAVTFKEIFPLIKNNQMWLGVSLSGTKCSFNVPDDYEGKNVFYENGVRKAKINNAVWFTNIDHKKRHEPLNLYKKYFNEHYSKYDNYEVIDCKTADIPVDYDGVIGVPITFLNHYCLEQFEIIKFRKGNDDKDLSVNGKCPYFRILIKRKEK